MLNGSVSWIKTGQELKRRKITEKNEADAEK